MLDLYGSGDPATLKLVLCLEELGFDYRFRCIDLQALENWSAAHRVLAPQGEAPLLVAEDRALRDATIAMLYLAESRREAGLLPDDAADRYDVQAQADVLDAALLGSVNLIGWHRQNDAAARAAFSAALAAVPDRRLPAGWSAVWRDAETDRLQRAEERIAAAVAKCEATLGGREWLVGNACSVADLCAFALLESVPALIPAVFVAGAAPRTAAWLERMHSRPAVRRALEHPGRSGGGVLYAPPA